VRLLANSRSNVLAFLITVSAQFVIVPIVIQQIGLPAFGQAGLVMAAWAPLTLIGTVVGQAATREIAANLAAGGTGKSLQMAALGLCGGIATIAALIFVLGGPYLLDWLDASNAGLVHWRRDVTALAPGWLAQQILMVMQGVAIARQDFRLVARLSIGTAMTSLGCTLALTVWWPGSTGYLWGVSASFAAATLVAGLLIRQPGKHRADDAPVRAAVGTLLRFGRWQSVSQLSGTISTQIDRYVLATLASPAVIGQFNAANRLQEAAYMIVMKAAEVLFPRFGAAAADSAEQRLRLFLLASWAVMGFSGLILAPVIVLAEPLMRLWVGAETAQGGAFLLQVLILGGLIGSGSSVFTFYLMGMGQTGTLAVISTLYSMLTIVLSILALLWLGPIAAGAGLALASLVRVLMALAWSRHRAFPASTWFDLVASTVVPLLASIALSAGLAWTLPVHAITAWWQLGLAFGATMIVVTVTVVATSATSRFGRDVLRSVLQRLHQRSRAKR